MSPILVPMSSFNGVQNFEDVDLITKISNIVKDQYAWQRSEPALLGPSAQAIGCMLAPLFTTVGEARETGNEL